LRGPGGERNGFVGTVRCRPPGPVTELPGMSDLLDPTLQAGGIAVCVKDTAKRVLSQNDCCRDICGDRRGETCTTGCMELYAGDAARQWKDRGSCLYQNSYFHGGFFDVTLLCTAESIITFLQPLADRQRMAQAYYREKGLTGRELDVVSLIIRGLSNRAICESLAISRATLRTHLNNIYRKCREQGEEPRFVPANRRPDFGDAGCCRR